jgi:hypothetical protein
VNLFIHPSVLSFIHGWHHTGKKTLAEINNTPLCANKQTKHLWNVCDEVIITIFGVVSFGTFLYEG